MAAVVLLVEDVVVIIHFIESLAYHGCQLIVSGGIILR